MRPNQTKKKVLLKKAFLFILLANCLTTYCRADISSIALLRQQTIVVTDDIGEWPPFVYFERIEGEKSEKVTGITPKLLSLIFETQSLSFDIRLVPWKRALGLVKSGEAHIAMAASYSDERANNYYLSEPYTATHPSYFYSKLNYPKGIDITHKSDIKRYRLLGVFGYNYEPYGLSKTDIDTGSKYYSMAIKKLHADRGDILLASIEILAGFRITGGTDLLADENIAHAYMPEMPAVPIYMLFPKSPLGLALKGFVDSGIEKLKADGQYKGVFKHYGL